jgi:hypothetical protein
VALDVELAAFTGQWFRQTPAGVRADTRPFPPDDNRWQHGSVVDAVYFALDRAGVWAEWYRHLAERGLPPLVTLPRWLWTAEVAAIELVDLRSANQLARVGLEIPTPGRRTWPPFQAVGEQLYADGYIGLVSRSAARPASCVACVFHQPPSHANPAGGIPGTIAYGDPETITDPPALPTGVRT